MFSVKKRHMGRILEPILVPCVCAWSLLTKCYQVGRN